jgi:hypothetical protein
MRNSRSSAIKISNGESFVELRIAETEVSLQAVGDARIAVQIQSSGFSGASDAWCSRDQIRSFCTSIIALDQTLKGECSLRSMSPENLCLLLSATTRGHIDVSGNISRRVMANTHWFLHSVTFGFDVEPAQLSSSIARSWIYEYTGVTS